MTDYESCGRRLALVQGIQDMTAPALAGFIDDVIAMRVRGEEIEDARDWIGVALERLDELADERPWLIVGSDAYRMWRSMFR